MKSRSHRLPTISDTPDDWVEESWTVDCVCGVNFDDGEEMVNCDECGVWVHTRCSRYVKSEKSFACDKCKNKNLRNESEETEVAQLLVELPTKTMRMENPCSMSCPPQNAFQVWTEIPVEEKVHVQGIPGGDPALFGGFSSVFSPQLWKCTGYVPKKFNFQYREFSCWEDGGNKSKEETENPASTGADALFSLSKDNELPTKVATLASQVEGGRALPQEKRQHSDLKKERSLPKPIVIHSGNRKKDDSRVIKDLNRRKTKIVDRELDSNRGLHSFASAHNNSSDAKQPESYEGKSPKVVKTDKQSCKDGSSRADVHAIRKAKCFKMINADNNPFCRGQASEKVYSNDSRHNLINKDKTMVENDGNQVPPGVEISTQSEDVMASSLIHNAIKIPSMENEVVNDHEKGSSRSDDVEKVAPATNDHQSFQDSNGELVASPLQQPVGVKAVEIEHPGETSNSRNLPTSDIKLDSAKSLAQDTAISPDPLSASVEVKDDAISVSQDQKGQTINRQADESACQPKGHLRGSKSSMVSRNNSSHGAEGPSNSRKATVAAAAAVAKLSSVGKPSSSSTTVGISKSSVSDQMRYSNTENAKQKGSKKDSEVPRDGERPKKLVKDLPKSLSTSALKSSHLSKFSHATISRKNSSDLRDPSSKTSPVQTTVGTQDSGDSATSLHGENKTTSESSLRGEKNNQLHRQPAPKNLQPSVHPPATTNSPATLSDEELALLLHQELNSSPRVPRVPRMRHAGSLPQLASPTPTSTLMKRTFTYGGKDNGLVSRKKNKDLPKDGSSNYRELDGAKVDRVPPVPNSRKHDVTENGSSKVTHSIDKSIPPASTTVSSGPSSSAEANEHNMSSTQNSPQNTSDDDTGAIGGPTQTHRTLPGLIAEIMSKGKRMTYEELCNAVLPHWPNLRKHNGERYAYSSHSQAVLDCLRNRSEWSRLVDRGPKTNASRKRRKHEADPESEEKDDSSTKDVDGKSYHRDEFPKGKRKARKRRRLALQGRGIKDVRRRRKTEVVSDDIASSSDSSEESMSSDDHEVGNEASGSSDETGAMS